MLLVIHVLQNTRHSYALCKSVLILNKHLFCLIPVSMLFESQRKVPVFAVYKVDNIKGITTSCWPRPVIKCSQSQCLFLLGCESEFEEMCLWFIAVCSPFMYLIDKPFTLEVQRIINPNLVLADQYWYSRHSFFFQGQPHTKQKKIFSADL